MEGKEKEIEGEAGSLMGGGECGYGLCMISISSHLASILTTFG